MSFAIDLSEHGSDLKKEYEAVVSSDPDTVYTIFGYDGSSNALKPVTSGSGDLDEFVESFDDSKIEYGLARVEFNNVNKIVLVGWVGENVSGRQRLVFNSHMASVAKQFPGHHIQITARSGDELSSEIILERVSSAAGSKYAAASRPAPPTKPKYVQATSGADEEDWDGSEAVQEKELKSTSGSGYKSSVREELEQLKAKRLGKETPKEAPKKAPKEAPKSVAKEESEEEPEEEPEEEEEEEEVKPKSSSNGISGLNSGTSYKPVGKIDLKKIREEGRNSKFADARIEKIEPSYKPVGKIDLKAIREQAKKEKELKAKKETGEPVSKKEDSFIPKKEEKNEDVEERISSVKSSYGPSAKKASQTSSASQGDDEEEPQFSSLADRMKAFQSSVSGAKPKYDIKPSRSSASRPTTSSSSSTRQDYGVGSSRASKATSAKEDDDEESEDDAPVSVAAQLAKARLSKKEDEPSVPKSTSTSSDSAPKANVSTFAARFAKKEEPKEEPKEESDEEPEAPAPPKREAPKAEPKEEPKAPKAAEPSDDGLSAVVIEAYTAEDDDELSLKLNDRITSIEQLDENWWLGESSSGSVGMFPSTHVKLDSAATTKSAAKAPEPKAPATPARREPVPEPEEEFEDEEEEEEEEDAPPPPPPAPKRPTPAAPETKSAKALYGYEAGDEDELEFATDDEITEIEFSSEDWWQGKNTKGEFGLFPANYVALN